MNTACKLCEKFAVAAAGNEIADQILFESENFVVVPTVGSIIPGWLLIIPRSHFLSIGSFDPDRFHELAKIKETATEALRDCFGPVWSFEHGTVRERESVGCGIDHAHLHVVATGIDLLAGAKDLGCERLQWRSVTGLQATKSYVAEQMPYVFVQSPSGDAWIGSANAIESQLVRKVIAAKTNQPDSWDWKFHPFEPHVEETVTKMEHWKAACSTMAGRGW
jgi:diadenosine tetraphosphate (Ap4A) HIT family hydrolase